MNKKNTFMLTLITIYALAGNTNADVRYGTDFAGDDQSATSDSDYKRTPAYVKDPTTITCSRSTEVCQYDTQNRLIYYLSDNRSLYYDHTDYHYTYDDSTGKLIEYARTYAYAEEDGGGVETFERVKFDPVSGNRTEQLVYDTSDNIYLKYDPTNGNITEEYHYAHYHHAEYDSAEGNVLDSYSGSAGYKKYDPVTGMVLEGGISEISIGGENNFPSATEVTAVWTYNYETNDEGELVQIRLPASGLENITCPSNYGGVCPISMKIYNSDGSLKSSNTIYYNEDDDVFFIRKYETYKVFTDEIFRWSEETQTFNGRQCVTEFFGDPDDPEEREVCSDVSYSTPMNMLKGKTVEDEQAENRREVYNEKDGSYTIYDKDNNIIGYKGKRIYTIQEANQVSAPTGNRVSLKYK